MFDLCLPMPTLTQIQDILTCEFFLDYAKLHNSMYEVGR